MDMFEEIVRIVCDCFTRDRLPNDESAWDQEEVRNFLKAAMGNGEPNAYIDVDLWTWLKTKIHGGSLTVSDNGLVGKMEAGRKEARVGMFQKSMC